MNQPTTTTTTEHNVQKKPVHGETFAQIDLIKKYTIIIIYGYNNLNSEKWKKLKTKANAIGLVVFPLKKSIIRNIFLNTEFANLEIISNNQPLIFKDNLNNYLQKINSIQILLND